MEKKLYRDEFHKKLGGVCAGLAEYFAVDVAIIRILFVLACILHGGGLLVYIVLWIALPKRPFPFPGPTVDYTVPPQNDDNNANSFGSSSFTNQPYANQPFQNRPFQNQPFPNQPFPNQPMQNQPRSTSLVAIIFGVVLIVVGGSILLDNFDIIPDWDLEHLWPIILITVGCVLMLSGNKKKVAPWDTANAATGKEEEKTTTQTETNPPADTPPAE